MHNNVTHKIKQFLFVLIKLSIVVGAFYFIYNKLVENENLKFNEFLLLIKENRTFSAKNIIFLIVLSGFNWFFEILKWNYLVKTVTSISLPAALEQSLGGLTASLITPNRIGDYGAKAIYFPKGFRKKIVLLNLLGHIAQMTITTLFGIVGLYLFVDQYNVNIDFNKILRFAIIILFVGIVLAFIIKNIEFKIKGFSIKRILLFIQEIPFKTHNYNLLFSLIRYLIFSFQFYYLLSIFGVEVGYPTAMVVITSMYFLASIVPSISIFDVVIKGSVAVFLFDFLGVNEITILSVSTLMWIFNFIVPSIFGSYFVLNFKLPNTEE